MVPLSLLIWIALETALYLAIARLGLQADWAYAAAGAVGGILGMRAGIVAITWMFGMAFASPAPRLGAGQTARLMLEEYLAFLFTFIIVLPFERLWMPADRPRAGQEPILLVHGYGCSRGVWWLLRRRLEAAGHSVASLSLTPPYASMGKLEPLLNARIEALCKATGSPQVQLLAHSMGGLICRSYLARHGRDRVSRLLTLATPHHGTELARLGFGRNAREMEAGSLWLSDMAGEPLNVPTISLRNAYDNYIMPQDNQRLAGARDIELPPVGHLAMLYDRQVAALLIDCCTEGKKTQ
ncbi:alpha/beta fold hydrolase [Dechloromonas denitrificans]|uniref:lipase family alpha/beta hydrolase n=1 Tax=Dechloromonas denitrificans TaxID=281362 RepID=UPI001CF8E772|nr:alpha/beta fold hydrolase [Dechloromonas denitrificans]UCV12995.1 alpha/beta fold hydrolase [Dechloromonas denitrificans]